MKKIVSDVSNELIKGRSVLLDAPFDCSFVADKISRDTALEKAVRFEGNVRYVYYICEYTPPCNKMREIKNLILCTNSVKGLRRNFSGIVMINLTEWINHESEQYFNVFLKFLYDKGNNWKYIFVLSCDDARKKEKMYREIIKVLRCTHLAYEDAYKDIAKTVADIVSDSMGVTFDKEAIRLIAHCITENRISSQEAENLLEDIVCETQRKTVTANDIHRYFDSPSCIYRELYKFDKERGIVE